MTPKPLHIMHIISDLHTGGAQSMLYRLLSSMPRDDIALTVVGLTDRGVVGDRMNALQVPVFYLGMKRGIPDPVGLWRLVRIIRKRRPLIVQSWLYHADLIGLLAGKLTGVPILLWNVRQSGMDMSQYSRLSRLVVKALARLSPLPDGVLVNSKAGQAAHTALGYRPRQWLYIPNGFDLERLKPDPAARGRFRGELGLPSETRLIGLIARYDPMKDHETFIRAALDVLNRGAEVHFVLAGPGVDAANQALMGPVTAQGQATYFHFLGDRPDVPAMMPAFDIYTMSSAFGEGFPNAVGEAMSCGVPCVATDVGDAAWIIGDTGTIVPPRDPAAMAAAWQQMLRLDAAEYARLGAAARRRMEEHFEIGAVAGQYSALYWQFAEDWYRKSRREL